MKKNKYFVLYPFAILYDIVTSIRNLLYDLKVFSSISTQMFSVGVGNLTVGGTGKTPVIDFLINNIPAKSRVVVSRGYGRKTSGFIEITNESTSQEVGDEPKMLYAKNFDKARFFVSESRVEAYNKILDEKKETDLILFDDVMQHRAIKPAMMIMLCDYNQPFYDDFLMPVGRLRENRRGAKRADIILVTKCPSNVSVSEKTTIELKIRKYFSEDKPVFFSYFESSLPINILSKVLNSDTEAILVSALANNVVFYDQMKQNYNVKRHFAFKDHHDFTTNDLKKIISSEPNLPIICTEKDYIKINNLLTKLELENVFVVNIYLKIFNEKEFLKFMNEKSKSFNEMHQQPLA